MSGALSGAGPWLGAGLAVLAVLLLLRRPLARLWRLALRWAGGLAALAALSPLCSLLGMGLGVNPVNALVLGLLGAPGLGLLLMVQ